MHTPRLYRAFPELVTSRASFWTAELAKDTTVNCSHADLRFTERSSMDVSLMETYQWLRFGRVTPQHGRQINLKWDSRQPQQ